MLHEKKILKDFHRGVELMPKLWCLELSWEIQICISVREGVLASVYVCSQSSRAVDAVIHCEGCNSVIYNLHLYLDKLRPLFMEVVTLLAAQATEQSHKIG